MKGLFQILAGAAALSTAVAAPIGATESKRDVPIHTKPYIKSVGIYAAEEAASDQKRDLPPIHTKPYIKSVGIYAVDEDVEEKRDLPPIHIKPSIKSVGIYAVDEVDSDE